MDVNSTRCKPPTRSMPYIHIHIFHIFLQRHTNSKLRKNEKKDVKNANKPPNTTPPNVSLPKFGI